jgi:hypothetical protein
MLGILKKFRGEYAGAEYYPKKAVCGQGLGQSSALIQNSTLRIARRILEYGPFNHEGPEIKARESKFKRG